MDFTDDDILENLIYDYCELLGILRIDKRIPLSAKNRILCKYLKLIQKEYKEFIKYDICSR